MSEKKYDDRKYISRGKFYVLHLDNTIMSEGVKQLNENKVGAPFVYSDTCFMVMALFRNTVGTAYRQMQGIIEEILGEENSPTFSAIYKRINKISLEDESDKSWFSDGTAKKEIVFLSGDSTGLKPTSRGDWMGQKWDVKRGFIKMHIMVDSDTKKIYAVSITDEKSGDAAEFKKLLSDALSNIENASNVVPSENLKVSADGAYDTNDNFKECEKKNITPVIPVRKNFSPYTKGSKTRKEQGLQQLGNCEGNPENIKSFENLTGYQKYQNQKQWKKDAGYGNRWAVEIAISTFKRVLGENISARVWRNVIREIKFKVIIYNLMIDDALAQEMNQN